MKNTIILFFCLFTLHSKASSVREIHARELMGPRYSESVVSRVKKKKNFEANIQATLTKHLPKTYKNQAAVITKAIIKAATLHSLDPYFVLAIISGESSFNPMAIGPVGEIGLMQIRPSTGEWMAKNMKYKWRGTQSLRDPVTNINLGTAYLAWLRQKFSGHGQLYVAAYNMGPRSVRKAVKKKIYPKDYPRHVMKRYVALYRDISEDL